MMIRTIVAMVWIVASAAVVALEQSPQQAEIEQLYSDFSKKLSVPDVQATEALTQQGLVYVDVRTEAEQSVSMLPGAIDVETYEALPMADRQNAVIYCTIGVRSGAYVAKLAEENIEAKNLAGGLLAWTHAGGLMQHNGEVVEHAHVYGRRWSLLPESYKVEWFWWVI